MKTKLRTSTKSQKKSILKNRNFLNNQNYVIDKHTKNYFINQFLVFQKMSIISNGFFEIPLDILFLYSLIKLSQLYISDLTVLLLIKQLLIFIVGIYIIINGFIGLKQLISGKLKNTIISFEQYFYTNDDIGIKKDLFTTFILAIFVIVGYFKLLKLFAEILNYFFYGMFYMNSSHVFIIIVSAILSFLSLLLFFNIIYTFVKNLNIRNILLFPIFIILYIIGLLKLKVLGKKQYDVIVMNMPYKFLEAFNALTFNYAKTKNLIVFKK